jgi:hypothetical protein
MDAKLDGVILTVSDFIPPYCAWGLRHWWREQNLDFKDFLKNGIPASTLWATGDDQARQVVTRKMEARRGK